MTTWKRRGARALSYGVFGLLVLMAGLMVGYTARLLSVYTCGELLFNQLLPFGLSLAVTCVFPGIPITCGWYVAENSWGRVADPRTDVGPQQSHPQNIDL